MNGSILIAGIGNIFHRDDAFGVYTVSRLSREPLPENVRAVDFGIRGIDLVFALLDGYEAIIFVDALPRGGAPGALYTLEPDLDAIVPASENGVLENAHGLDPLKVLALAKGLGAPLGRVFVVGCEPAVIEDGTGAIGLTPEVEPTVEPAIEMIRSLLTKLNNPGEQLCTHTGNAVIPRTK